MQRLIITLLFISLFSIQGLLGQTLDEMLKDYRFEHRIKGPEHKRSQLLEVKVDKNNNYLALTFAATSYRYIHLYIYRLYTWEAVQELRVEAKRIELYNSEFDPEGNYFYANTDVYKNEFKKVDLKTGEITECPCSEVPNNGCRPLEVRQYETTKYTVGENYVIFQDEKFDNYVRIFVRKELYKVQNQKDDVPDFLMDGGGDDDEDKPKGSGIPADIFTIYIEPGDIKDLKEFGYLKVKKFELLVDDNMAKTFKFNELTTNMIVMPKTAIDSIENHGGWIKGDKLRVAIK
ncbi:MAG: hypothetical protein C0599_07280 [Salinivirgaceae bacterium]|nr:MAG: hypothetical protein C0599_07280 [Salinivirgaceae bacterium]